MPQLRLFACTFFSHNMVWADDNRAMVSMAKDLAADEAQIVAPSLNYAMTWLRIEPLVTAVEQQAMVALEEFPDRPWRIIGHSMGGLIWLELLNRRPDWRLEGRVFNPGGISRRGCRPGTHY